MRIRQVKPAFWSDPILAALSEATRLFYIGLWMEADDAGWLRWDAAEIAHDLYGYESRVRREHRVEAMFVGLRDAGRLTVHVCGHIEIPTLVEHQRLSGATKQVRTVFNEHLKLCGVVRDTSYVPQVPAGSRESPLIPESPRPVRNGKEREREQERSGLGTVSAQARDDETEFQRKVSRAGALGGATR